MGTGDTNGEVCNISCHLQGDAPSVVGDGRVAVAVVSIFCMLYFLFLIA